MIDIRDLVKEQKKKQREIKRLEKESESLLKKYELSVGNNTLNKKPLLILSKEQVEKKIRKPSIKTEKGVIQQSKNNFRYEPTKGKKTKKDEEIFGETYDIDDIIKQIRENSESIERIDFRRSTFGTIKRK